METLAPPQYDPSVEGPEALSPTVSTPLEALSDTYISSLMVGHEGFSPVISTPLHAIAEDVITARKPTVDGMRGVEKYIRIPIEAQLSYIDDYRKILGEQATFDAVPIEMEGDGPKYLKWLSTIAEGHWPIAVGTDLERHDRTDHLDSLVNSPPEQAMLIKMAAGYVVQARKADKDIIIPKRFGGSMRGETLDNTFVGHLDNVSDTLGDLSQQTKMLLGPLVNKEKDFSGVILEHYQQFTAEIDAFAAEDIDKLPPCLALALGALETITLATQDRDASPEEVKIALYGVLKGYVQTAAKLRGEAVPEGALDLWPLDERGAQMTITVEEMLFDLAGGDRKLLDPRLEAMES